VRAAQSKIGWKGRATRGALVGIGVAAGLPMAWLAAPAHAADADIKVTEAAPRASSTALGKDWIELTNTGSAAVDLAGWRVDDDSNSFASALPISGVTSLAPGESAVLVTEATAADVAAFATAWFGGTAPAGLQIGWLPGSGLGLGNGGDQVNVFTSAGVRVANISFGAAPSAAPYGTFDNTSGVNGTVATYSTVGVQGAFVSANGAEIGSPGIADGGGGNPPPTTVPPTTTVPPGTAFTVWPGSPDVQPIAAYDFGGDMSGLDFEGSGPAASGVLWAARNKAGTMFRLVFDGTNWAPDTANGWGAGKELRFPGGTGHPDSEGITYAGSSSAGGIYVASERDNDNSGVSRNSVLRYDVTAAGTTLSAAQEWNLTADLPATGANLGFEAITWIPDAHLVAKGFVDQSSGHAYDPAEFPGHGDGLFFLALEATGQIYAYALNSDGTFARLATIASELTTVTDLQYDPDEQLLWASCDNTCSGRHTVLQLDQGSGAFAVTGRHERPAHLGNNNNEGFAVTPDAACVAGAKPVYWADDSATGGVSIVAGAVTCGGGPDPVVPEFPVGALAGLSAVAMVGGWVVLRRRWGIQAA
jgi:hypothetical protein